MRVEIEKDLVILTLASRGYDTLLKCADAEKLVHTLRDFANRLPDAQRIATEVWGCLIESYDGTVAMRFLPPHPGAPKRIPLPKSIALKLADKIEFRFQQAKYKMRFVLDI